MPIPSTCEEWDQLFQSRPLQPAEQDQLLKWSDMLNLAPRIQEQLDELKDKLIRSQAEQAKQAEILKQLLINQLGIKTRDIDNFFKFNYWKVEDWRLRWVKEETKSAKKRLQHNVYNTLAHDFTVADAHERLRQLWAEPTTRKQICDHIAGLPRDTPENQFLELTTSVSPELLSHISSSKQLYALQLSKIFILISFSLRQNYNKIQTPLSRLKAEDGFEWKEYEDMREQPEYDPMCLSIQENETLDQNYRRIRDNLCRGGGQNISEKSNEDGQVSELKATASQQDYYQLLSVLKRFAEKYARRVPSLLAAFESINSAKSTASGRTIDKMSTARQFHTMLPHRPTDILKASPKQHPHTPKFLSAAPHRPGSGRPLVGATPSNMLAQTVYRGFRFLYKRG
ncbi:MAG: hypothetical protein Q9225_003543 [Loekoesia sp. 1 TL-2023]